MGSSLENGTQIGTRVYAKAVENWIAGAGPAKLPECGQLWGFSRRRAALKKEGKGAGSPGVAEGDERKPGGGKTKPNTPPRGIYVAFAKGGGCEV